MIHLDDGVLRSWLDRELPADAAAGVGGHVDGCGDCRARVRELRRAETVVHDALALLDGPAPGPMAWAGLTQRLNADADRPARTATTRPDRSNLVRAAAIIFLLGGGVAAAVLPGSPLRSLFVSEGPAAGGDAGAVARRVDSAVGAMAGVRTPLADGSLLVRLSAPPGTEVVVALTDERPGLFAAPSTTFSAETGLLRAVVTEGAVRVELPEGAGSSRIEVNGTTRVEVRNGALVMAPGAPEPVEAEGDVLVRFRIR